MQGLGGFRAPFGGTFIYYESSASPGLRVDALFFPTRGLGRYGTPRPGAGNNGLTRGSSSSHFLTMSFHELARCHGGYRRLLSESCKSDRTETDGSDSDD